MLHPMGNMADNDKAPSTIWQARVYALDSLECAITSLEKYLIYLKDKISRDGISGYYSSHSDVLRHAQTVWAGEKKLYLLREIQVYEDEMRDRIEQLGKETHHVRQEEDSEEDP